MLCRTVADGTVSVSMFYLVGHERHTYGIDMEPHRLDCELSYMLDQSFDLAARLQPLSELEAIVPPHSEGTAIFYEVQSWACADGCVIIKPTRYAFITDPLPKRKTPNADDDGISDDAADVDDDQLVVGTELSLGLIIITSCVLTYCSCLGAL